MGLQEQHWYMDIIRYIFGLLDSLVYGLIKWIMYGIFDLSSLSTNSEVFNGIYSRIYVILGIFMAFKLSFSFFQYIIEPDSMGPKSEKGVSKLFIRVFTMLFALIALPAILFGQNGQKGLLQRSQDAFLPMLPRLIFGSNDFGNTSTAGGVTATVEQSSEEIAVETLKGFFHPPEDLDTVCKAGTLANTPELEHLDDFLSNINITCTSNGTGLLGTNIAATKYYKYTYLLFISTVVGVLEAVLLLAITLDIAKRIFKMIILEVIAPVPIMSLIDPKGAKDGAFSKWLHSLTSTFLDIFIKLGLVYLIIVLIHMIVNANDKGGIFLNFPSFSQNGFRAVYLTILLILGLIFFAKEAPKFIKDALGIKDNGGDLFDDVKTLGKAAGLVTAGAGVVGSAIASGRASYDSDTANGRNHNAGRVLKNIGAGLIGGIGGASTALHAANAKDASFGSIMKAQNDRNTRVRARGAAGGSWLGGLGTGVSRVFTGETAASRIGRTLANLDTEQGLIKSIKQRASSEMVKKDATRGAFGTLGGSFNYKAVKAAMDAASASGASSISVMDYNAGHNRTFTMEEAYANIGTLLANNEADYIACAGSDDPAVRHGLDQDVILQQFQEEAEHQGYNYVHNRSNLGSRSDAIDVEKTRVKREQARAQANDRYSASKK